jgi:hypothetical protein
MISKLCASWFVVLILSPFTAPFSTCDLSSLLGHTAQHSAPLGARTSPLVAQTNTAPSAVPAFANRRVRSRVLTLSTLHLSGIAVFSTELRWPAASAGPVDIPPAFATILRL